MPTGPSVLVLPGTAKSLDQFRSDDFECRQFAQVQLGGATPTQSASESGARSAAVGTAAGTGAENRAYDLQRKYDYGYMQCMYAKGHKIPVPESFVYSDPATAPAYAVPPPPQSPPASQ
ncbi:MAG TPA: hypothetical protein VK460_03425 [Burkholderiales bacterium]|nr:hypothetical protein [Burkholderiales bacterium]